MMPVSHTSVFLLWDADPVRRTCCSAGLHWLFVMVLVTLAYGVLAGVCGRCGAGRSQSDGD